MALSDDIEFVRFLISDQGSEIFSDTELQMVINRTAGLYLAAAILMERIADNETLIAKVIRTQDLSTDGPKVAADLRASAKQLRADHAAEIESGSDSSAVVEFDPYAGLAHPELTGTYVVP